MGLPVLQVDAFTAQPFAGNPAALCLLERAGEAAWMQAVAAEMNLSETAFLVPRLTAGNPGGFDLRWFTPTVEVDLCGHATLASAHALWEVGRLPAGEPARFHTRSGVLTCRKDGAWIWMDFPASASRPAETPAGLVEGLGLAPSVCPEVVARSSFFYLAVLGTEAAVRALKPDPARLRALPVVGVIATARADEGRPYDFVSRCFAPAAGIDEDPVTGAAHCALAPYWSVLLGRTALTGFQASRRGGIVRVEVKGERVLLGGQAVTVLRGELV